MNERCVLWSDFIQRNVMISLHLLILWDSGLLSREVINRDRPRAKCPVDR